MAISKARQLFGCYRKGEAHDPDTYVAAISAVLARYPPEIVQQVTDPRTGVPRHCDWLPTVKEVGEACEEMMLRDAQRIAREEREQKQLAERKRLDEYYRDRPRVDLAAQYPPNWGLSPERNDDAARKHMARVAHSNRVLFERECRAAGVDPATASVSPSLAKLLAPKEVP